MVFINYINIQCTETLEMSVFPSTYVHIRKQPGSGERVRLKWLPTETQYSIRIIIICYKSMWIHLYLLLDYKLSVWSTVLEGEVAGWTLQRQRARRSKWETSEDHIHSRVHTMDSTVISLLSSVFIYCSQMWILTILWHLFTEYMWYM